MQIFEFLTQIHHQKLNLDPFYPFMPKLGYMTGQHVAQGEVVFPLETT